MKNVLLTSGRFPAALDLARKLAAQGVQVYLGDSEQAAIGRYSRLLRKSYQWPHPNKNPEAFLRAIDHICHSEAIDTLIPCFEEGFLLAAHRDHLPPGVSLFFPDLSTAETLHDKLAFIRLVQKLGFAAAYSEAVVPGQKARPERLQSCEVVIKPRFTRGGSEVQFLAEKAPIPSLDPLRSYLIQEKIPGRTLCSFALVQTGRVTLSLTYEPLLTLGHVSSAFRPLYHAPLNHFVETLAAETKFHGFLAFDVIETPSGQLLPIECNPRLTSGVHLLTEQALGAALIKGESVWESSHNQEAGVWLGMLYRLWQDGRRGQPDLKQWLKLCRRRDVIFSLRDPLPFFAQFYTYAELYRKNHKDPSPLTTGLVANYGWEPDTLPITEEPC